VKQASENVIVIGPDAALKVRGGSLTIDWREGNGDDERRTIRLDVDADMPRAVLFDGRGEFLTGEAIRFCARYGIAIVMPDGPGRLITFIHSALEADGNGVPDISPMTLRAQCAANALAIAKAVVDAKIDAEARHMPGAVGVLKLGHWRAKADAARSIPELLVIEARASAVYWRAFRDMGLREAKGGNLPRTWLRFANRQKGGQFLGSKHAKHPVSAMLNYAYVVEAGRLARTLSAKGLALQIGYLHADKTGRNSLVWDTIEPIRPMITGNVFKYIASREWSRKDFPQTGANVFRLDREVCSQMLSKVLLPQRAINDAADFMLSLIERHSPTSHRLFKPDRRRGSESGDMGHARF
jgi:CRISP-associated protein Cas1